jgi:uncharacterized phage protein gp47/JayE
VTLSLASLLVPKTSDQWFATYLGILELVGLPTTSWGPKSVPVRILRALSDGTAEVSLTVSQITRGGYSELAEDEWLTLRSRSQYENEREPPVATEGVVTLVDDGGGPHTIAVGSIRVKSSTDRFYVNTTDGGGTLALDGTLAITIKAEEPGTAYNVAGSELELVTSLPTVELDVASDWITISGTDGETDARLRDRNRTKWGTLGTGSPPLAVANWVLAGVPNVTKVSVQDWNPLGDGTVQVVLATDSGPASPADVAAAQAIFNGKRVSGSSVVAVAADPVTVDVVATVYVPSASKAAAQAEVVRKFAELTAQLAIGGTIYRSKLIDVLHAADKGVRNVVLTTPSADATALSFDEVATFNIAGVAWVGV